MKIAYLLYPGAVVSNKSNGIRSQAKTWADELKARGHRVDLMNEWVSFDDWETYDIIHLFGPDQNKWMQSVSSSIASMNANIVYSPIIDPEKDRRPLRECLRNLRRKFLATRGVYSRQYGYCKLVLARSNCEREYLTERFGLLNEKVKVVPLSYSAIYKNLEIISTAKKPFVFHLSSLAQSRKNVGRLIDAAKKYGFKLVLAGSTGSDKDRENLCKKIDNTDNIELLGFINEEQKLKLYKEAKVFALPSLCEGVGIVALDAALFGCEVVITDIPGPKEYYNGQCFEVNPYDVDSIGRGVMDALNNKRYQPELGNMINSVYSPEAIAIQLEQAYVYCRGL